MITVILLNLMGLMLAGQTGNNGRIDGVEIIIPLKY